MATTANVDVNPAMVAELERLRAENAALKARQERARTISFKVSEKGGVSVYGLGRFPVTLYKEQWAALLAVSAELRAFIAEHAAELKVKGEASSQRRSLREPGDDSVNAAGEAVPF